MPTRSLEQCDWSSCPYLKSEGPTSDFDSEIFGHHAVAGSKVSVDELVGIEVCHAVGDLARHLDHLAEAGRSEGWIILLEIKKKIHMRIKEFLPLRILSNPSLCNLSNTGQDMLRQNVLLWRP